MTVRDIIQTLQQLIKDRDFTIYQLQVAQRQGRICPKTCHSFKVC